MESDKLLSPEVKFSPISVSQSPVVTVQGNLTGTVRQIRDLVADIYNLSQKWNNAFIKGIPLIQDIIDLKLDSLGGSDCESLYPKGLQGKIDELDVIFTDLVSIVESMKNIFGFLKGIRKLEEARNTCTEPLFITWPVSKFETEASFVATAFEEELKIKKYVKENICHSSSKDLLNSFTTLWIQQCFVDSETIFRIEAMLKETGHR